MAHDGDPVQGRLTVEQDQVVVDHVTLNNVAGAEVLRDLERLKWVTRLNHVTQKKLISHLLLVSEPEELLGLDPALLGRLNKVGARVDVGAV